MLSTPYLASDRMETTPGSRSHSQQKAAWPCEHSGRGHTAWEGDTAWRRGHFTSQRLQDEFLSSHCADQLLQVQGSWLTLLQWEEPASVTLAVAQQRWPGCGPVISPARPCWVTGCTVQSTPTDPSWPTAGCHGPSQTPVTLHKLAGCPRHGPLLPTTWSLPAAPGPSPKLPPPAPSLPPAYWPQEAGAMPTEV